MRLDTAVTQLQQQPDGTIRVTAAPAATVLADSDTSVSSTVYIADRVIVTVPLALLQRNVISFTPPLSAVKQRAINGLGAGECAKVVLTFKEAFWPQEMSFLFTARPSQVVWRPSEGHSGAGAENSTTITAFFAGRDCKRLAGASEADAVSSVLKDLDAMFGRENLADELVQGHYQDWSADPWAGMAYSFTSLGSRGMRKDLRVDEWGGSLLFAGEATSGGGLGAG